MKEKRRKAKMWARRCFYLSAAKLVFCIIGVMFSGDAPRPDAPYLDHIGFAWGKIGFCFLAVGATLVPLYRELMMPEAERVDTRRYIGFAIGVDGVVDFVRLTWPHEWHSLMWVFGYPFVFFFILAMHFDLSGPDDKPRKKRKFKAKWPAWIKKRWSPTPRHHRPQPQPQPYPQPNPRPTN